MKKRKYDPREPEWRDLRGLFPILATTTYEGYDRESCLHSWSIKGAENLENGDVVRVEFEFPLEEEK